MSNTMIDNECILKDYSHSKKLKLCLNRIAKTCKEIEDMGYIIYVSAHGSFNVMNIDDVPYIEGLSLHQGQVVASTQITGLDCGDW